MMFASLVMMFSSQAMMAMGKIHNPVTGKIDRDLNAAQYMIEMLAMLEERTKGNITEQESTMLATTLRDLRLNYVVEMNKDQSQQNPAAPAADSTSQPEMQEGVPGNQG